MSRWSECYVCGLDFREDEMVRHYRSKRLVDAKCADEPTHTDFMNWMNRRVEERHNAEQPVSGQGEVSTPKDGWYTANWYVSKWRA